LWWQIVYAVVGFDLFVAAIVLYSVWWRRRGKLEVRIQREIGEQRKWFKPDKDGKTIVAEKAKEGKTVGWSFEFSRKSLIPVISMITGRAHWKIEVMYGAAKAIDYDFFDKNNPYNLPVYDRRTFEDLVTKEVQKMLPRMVKVQLPTLFWLIVIMQVVTMMLVIASMMGLKVG
jgi:hypothetical protein